MTVIGFGAAKGSPGVTTTVSALAARWPDHREPLVIEADPSGGDLVARLASLTADDGGVRERPSTVQLAAVSRSSVSKQSLLEHLQRLPGPGEVRALVAPAGAFAASTAINTLASAGLSKCLHDLDGLDTLIDAGRVDPASPTMSLLGGADRVLLVARPSLESVVHTRDLAASLRGSGCPVSVVVIGDRPYAPLDVADAVGADELVGVLPDDWVGARALAGDARSPRVLARCRLVRAAAELAQTLVPHPVVGDADERRPRPPTPLRMGRVGLSPEVTP